MRKIKDKLVTHADHIESRRAQHESRLMPTCHIISEGDRCAACRGGKIARHVDAQYIAPREEFFYTHDGLMPSAPELASTKLEVLPRECEVCGGTGIHSNSAVSAYFERHPERVCGCQAQIDQPCSLHAYDKSINGGCPLLVTYVRTEEETLREEVTERRTREWRERGEWVSHGHMKATINLEVALEMTQRSTTRLLDVLQDGKELSTLAASIHADKKPFELNLYPCKYDLEKLDRIASGLMSRRVIVTRMKHGFRAVGDAYFNEATARFAYTLPQVDPKLSAFEWRAMGRDFT